MLHFTGNLSSMQPQSRNTWHVLTFAVSENTFWRSSRVSVEISPNLQRYYPFLVLQLLLVWWWWWLSLSLQSVCVPSERKQKRSTGDFFFFFLFLEDAAGGWIDRSALPRCFHSTRGKVSRDLISVCREASGPDGYIPSLRRGVGAGAERREVEGRFLIRAGVVASNTELRRQW